MWGELKGQEIKDIKESFCLGEACLIFDYGNSVSRTIAFRTIPDLRKAQNFFKQNQRNFIIEIVDKEVHIITQDIKTILNVVNNTHAERLKEVLDNYKK